MTINLQILDDDDDDNIKNDGDGDGGGDDNGVVMAMVKMTLSRQGG